jgi:DNA-binding CsgD family transcriptional regulator
VADPPVEVIGRAAESAQLQSFAARVAAGPAALVLEGDAGMGKTTLWSSGVADARDRGYHLLVTRPAAAEARLAFTGLGDLLGGVLDELLEVLPGIQAEALRVALLLEWPQAPLDDRAVGVSVLSALRALSARRPVLLAVDDVQWLDAATAAVLSFAWRRLETEPVGVLLARRSGRFAPRALDGLRPARSLELAPLSAEDVHRILRRRLGVVFPRPALQRVHAVSGGNPFFALEIGRAFDDRRELLAAGRLPPLPGRLLELVADRIGALPAATREVLAAVAALSQPTLALITACGGDEALRPAFAAHVVESDGERLRFSHPLLAAAAYDAVDPVARRDLHRRIAAVVSDEDERARLLALASDGPDEDVAGALERAAARAQQRGASAVAAELCEQSLRLSPRDLPSQHERRAVSAARYHWAAGDTDRARVVLAAAVDDASGPAARAEALTELAWVHVFQADQPGGATLARRALADLDDAATVRPHALNCLATALVFMLEDLDESARLSALAVEVSERRGDVVARTMNLCGVAYVSALLGRPGADALLQEAEDVGEQAWGWRVVGWPRLHRAGVSRWTDRPERAVARYRALRDRALERGDYGSIPTILAYLALAEFATGQWTQAEATATECREAAAQAGERPHEAMALAARALVSAARGRRAKARADAVQALELSGERSVGEARIHAHWALALLDLADGRPEHAAGRLGPLRARLVAGGVGEPGVIPFAADEVEALVGAGRVPDARAALRWLEERGRALDRASALAAAWSGRGLLAAAAGAHDAAVEAFARAVEQHARVPMPFPHARTLLHLGAAQRRAKRKREARATLGQARRMFDALGAAPWSRRAGEELARISGRRPSEPGLTATERRIAELVAEGRTNKEVAAALFLSPRTVESHLRQVFQKLGVRSRTELARRVSVVDQTAGISPFRTGSDRN